MSALLTTTMVKQKTVIEKLEEAGMRARVKVMVGGAPVTQEWATRIGADGFSPDAIGSVHIAKQLMGKA
jgi:5-methyltetrahydrofolate--homocysteine methyltransferase